MYRKPIRWVSLLLSLVLLAQLAGGPLGSALGPAACAAAPAEEEPAQAWTAQAPQAADNTVTAQLPPTVIDRSDPAGSLPSQSVTPPSPEGWTEEAGFLGAPYLYEVDRSEKVALNSGALVYETEDLVLPGINGLDLVIGRRYNSQNASSAVPGGKSRKILAYEYYVFPCSVSQHSGEPDDAITTDGDPIAFFPRRSEAYEFAALFPYPISETTSTAADGCTVTCTTYAAVGVTRLDNAYTIDTVSRPNDHDTGLYGLGHGWSLRFSSIEQVDGTSYLRLGDGGSWEINFDDEGSHLRDYPLEDLTLEKECGEFSAGGTASYYRLTRTDGRREYFDADGRLIGIRDRYDNTISLVHSVENGYPRIVITDTLGRTVVLSGAESETGHVMTLTGPEGFSLRYEVTHADGLQALAASTDAAGRTTRYSYTRQSVEFDASTHQNQTMSADYLNLTTVTHPTQAQTVYTYSKTKRNLGPCGRTDIYKLVSRADRLGTETVNSRSYTYIRDCSGYPEYSDSSTLPGAFTYYTSVTDAIGRNTYITFNGYHLQTMVQVSAAEQRLYRTEYSYDSRRQPAEVRTYTYGGTDGNASMLSVTMEEHDSRGRLTASWSPLAEGDRDRTEYRTVYTYADSWDLPLSRTWKTDGDTTLEERNTPDETGKNIGRTERYENGVLTARTDFLYDALGRLTGERRYHDGFSAYDSIAYSYDSSEDGGSSFGEIRSGILTADGTPAASSPGQAAGTLATSYEYDGLGRTAAYVDGKGNRTLYTYDGAGHVTSVTWPDGASVTYAWDYGANAVTVTDELGAQTKYTYTPLGLEYEKIDVLTGSVMSRREYDASSRLIRLSDFVYGAVTAYTYDALDRVTAETVTQGATVLAQTLYAYDDAAENGVLRKVTRTVVGDSNAPSLVTTQYTDAAGRAVRTGRVSGGTEHTDVTAYDYAGRPVETLTAADAEKGLSFSARYRYNGLDQTVSTQTPAGTAANTYDALGRLVRAHDYTGSSTVYTYDALGRLLTETVCLEDDSVLCAAPGTPEAQAAAGAFFSTTKYDYDVLGNRTRERRQVNGKEETARWASTDYVYDVRGRLTSVRQYDGAAVAATTSYTYDLAGDLLSVTADGGTTSYTYDRFGNVLTMTDPLGNTEARTYSPLGRLQRVTDRNGHTSLYTYDALGRVRSRYVYYDELCYDRLEYTYTKTGQVRTEQALSEWITDIEIADETREYIIHKQTQKTTYTYNALGYLVKMAEEDRSETTRKSEPYIEEIPIIPVDPEPPFEVMSQGETTIIPLTDHPNAYTLTYTYDLAGRRTGLTLRRNNVQVQSAAYTYDTKGRLATVSEGGALQASYTYDACGNRTGVTYANGVTERYTYNRAGFVTSIQHRRGDTLLAAYDYTYYADGSRRTQTDHTGQVTSYTYDGLGRLTRESVTGGLTLTYLYDDAGNRTRLTASGSDSYSIAYTYDAAGRLLRMTQSNARPGTEATEYTYSGNGELLSEQHSLKRTVYAYNGLGQLRSRTLGTASTEYAYTARGIRTGKAAVSRSGTISYTDFLLDGSDVIAEATGNTVAVYLRGTNLICQKRGTTLSYYLFNAHGDVTALTGAGGAVTERYEYDAFGNTTVAPVSAVSAVSTASAEPNASIPSLSKNPFRYCGEYWDSETGTYYLRARYYNPALGRFTQQDAHWSPANRVYGDSPQRACEYEDRLGLNLYSYAPQLSAIRQSGNLYVYGMNDPVKYADYNGEIAFLVVTGLIGAVVGGIIGAVRSYSKYGEVHWQDVVLGVGLGAAAGLVGGAGIAYLTTGTATASFSMIVDSFGNAGTATTSQAVAKAASTSEAYSKWNFRKNLQALTGVKGDGLQAHHVLPQVLENKFDAIGIRIHDPIYGSWVDASHQSWSAAYNRAWYAFFQTVQNPTVQQVLDKARELAKEYGFTIYF